jgi:hypothetical protein
MEKLIAQMQAVLLAVSTILPITPAKHRAALAGALDTIAAALKVGELAAGAAEDLAAKFAALRVETEQMAEIGEAEMEAAFARVTAASAAFRAAFAQSSAF